MKAIKITSDNASAIESTLKAVNGSCANHAYTSFADVQELAECAEQNLEGLGLPIAQRKGAMWAKTSGGKVANSYKGITRNATTVKLERRASGWFMVDAHQTSIFKQGGGAGILTLTKAQAYEATSRFQQRFRTLAA